MSCTVFGKIRKDPSVLEGMLAAIKRAHLDLLDVSAKPSLDQSHFFVRLTLNSDVETARRLFGIGDLPAEVKIADLQFS